MPYAKGKTDAEVCEAIPAIFPRSPASRTPCSETFSHGSHSRANTGRCGRKPRTRYQFSRKSWHRGARLWRWRWSSRDERRDIPGAKRKTCARMGAKVKPPEEKHRKVARDVLREARRLAKLWWRRATAPTQAKTGMQRRRTQQRLAYRLSRKKPNASSKTRRKRQLFPSEASARRADYESPAKEHRQGRRQGGNVLQTGWAVIKQAALWTVDAVTGVIVVNAPGPGFRWSCP